MDANTIVGLVCALVVSIATIPVVVGAYQHIVLGLSMFRSHLEKAAPFTPRVAIVVPAWNEASVVGATIDRLMKLQYPKDRLRIYIIDDASTDDTPHIVNHWSMIYPENVFHIRRVAGGEGKAHTLNYGLATLLSDDWMEAVLIMDADVIYTETSLLRMTRHLADPEVGAVTAYIKEGSRNPTYVQQFIGFEYITATGCSRRAQNVLGFLACLSGGAQLHSRENLVAIGGSIFSDTLAEDTFTTFYTQLNGRKAIFEPNAIVYAEEPARLVMLWKQRLRWARGNVQITQEFASLWFRKQDNNHLGSKSMGFVWFSIFLMPVLQMSATAGLLCAHFLDGELAWQIFQFYWIMAGIAYLLVTLSSFAVDPESARKSWLAGFLFPGFISLAIVLFMLFEPFLAPLKHAIEIPASIEEALVVFMYLWLSASMLVSYAAKECEDTRLEFLSPILLHIGGYGSFLCAVTFAAYIKELRGEARTWDKTEKTGTVL